MLIQNISKSRGWMSPKHALFHFYCESTGRPSQTGSLSLFRKSLSVAANRGKRATTWTKMIYDRHVQSLWVERAREGSEIKMKKPTVESDATFLRFVTAWICLMTFSSTLLIRLCESMPINVLLQHPVRMVGENGHGDDENRKALGTIVQFRGEDFHTVCPENELCTNDV